jgi:hypothetical protein
MMHSAYSTTFRRLSQRNAFRHCAPTVFGAPQLEFKRHNPQQRVVAAKDKPGAAALSSAGG